MYRKIAVGISIGAIWLLQACGNKINAYEKLASFPRHEWISTDTPSFSFQIQDTVQPYQLFFVIRHGDAYRYRNIWLNIQVKDPDSTYNVKREFKLADGEKWLGTGMDDIYEQRIPFSKGAHILKKGNYTFTLQQIMREDSLAHVLNAGIRVERIPG